MYFGSVKFFKQLIYAIFFLWLAAATFLAAFFGFKYFSSDDETVPADAAAQNEVVIPEGTGTEQLYLILMAKGYSTEEILSVIESGDTEVFQSYVSDYIDRNPDAFKTEEDAVIQAGDDDDLAYKELYPELYVENPPTSFRNEENTIYLTFDDGPSDNTEDILEILDRYDIKATFFFSGGYGEREQELMKMVADAGHAIGVHSISHDYNKIYESVESFLDDFYETYDSIYQATGIKPEIFRFAGGSINNYNRLTYMQIIAEMTRRGFVYYDWNVSGDDAVRGADWTSIYNNVLNGVRSNSSGRAIVLLHDGADKEYTVLVLEDVIDALLADGYSFDKLDSGVKPTTFTYKD